MNPWIIQQAKDRWAEVVKQMVCNVSTWQAEGGRWAILDVWTCLSFFFVRNRKGLWTVGRGQGHGGLDRNGFSAHGRFRGGLFDVA
jgi:hypothetical protein